MTADPGRLARIHGESFTVPRPWTAVEIAGLLATPGAFLIEAPDGFLIGRALAGEAELLTLAVAPSARPAARAQHLSRVFSIAPPPRGPDARSSKCPPTMPPHARSMRRPALPRQAGGPAITAGPTAAPRMHSSLPARLGLRLWPNRVRLLDQSVKLIGPHAESLLTGKCPFALIVGNPRR